jgi:hypothetical protein
MGSARCVPQHGTVLPDERCAHCRGVGWRERPRTGNAEAVGGVIGTREDAAIYCYELKMIQGLLPLLDEQFSLDSPKPWDITARNGLLETHLLHSRILVEFFFPGNHRDDDIVSSDFLEPGWEPTGLRVERLKVATQEIHKRLAHLTRRRLTSYDWDPILIAGDVMGISDEFLDQLNGSTGRSWFDEAAKVSGIFEADWGDSYRRILNTGGLED